MVTADEVAKYLNDRGLAIVPKNLTRRMRQAMADLEIADLDEMPRFSFKTGWEHVLKAAQRSAQAKLYPERRRKRLPPTHVHTEGQDDGFDYNNSDS